MSIQRLVLVGLLGALAAACDQEEGLESETIESDIIDTDDDPTTAGSEGAAGSGDGDEDVDAPGDGDDDADGVATDAGGAEPIEIAGTWYNEEIDLVETFSDTAITGDFVPVEIAAFDNAHNTLVLRFDAEYDPSQSVYTKVVWLEPDEAGFYYCPIAFDLSSIAEAFDAADTSDRSDVDGVGCDWGPWTRDVPIEQMIAD